MDAFREKSENPYDSDFNMHEINITVGLNQNIVTIDFEDNAGGIPAKYIETVFDPILHN